MTAAEIIESDGRQVWPRTEIRVAWPPGAATDAPVGALSVSRKPPTHRIVLQQEIERFPPGTRITVRVADGRPWADVTDRFALAWTIGMTLLGFPLAAVGWVLNRSLR